MFIVSMCVCVCVSSYTCMSHSSHKEIYGVSSLLLPLLGFWMLNSGHQVCHRESLYPLIYRVGSTISFVSHFSSFIISFCVAMLVVNSISHYVKICFFLIHSLTVILLSAAFQVVRSFVSLSAQL